MEHNCECCKYSTFKRFNYDKHLLSKTHLLITEKAKVSQQLAKISRPAAEISQIKCKYCGQIYKHKSSLSKHIKYTCTKNKDEDLKE